MKTLLSGASIYTECGFVKKDILIEDGVIIALTDSLDFDEKESAVSILNYSGKYIFPGFVDVHVHFREPGFLYKEDIATGTKAAARGGYSHVFTMPNLNPVPDCIENIKEELDAIGRKAKVKVFPYASITKGEKGNELVNFEEIKAFCPSLAGFSDDGTGVEDASYMKEAMERVAGIGGIISAHCEVKSLIGGKNVHDGCLSRKLGYNGISSESEWKMVERDIKLCKETGCRYHVCHVSTKESVELIRKAKAEGIDITCETAPHYLLLEENVIADCIMRDSTSPALLGKYKMNPPLRAKEDMDAVRAGLLDGTIDMIATDHAPHSDEEKALGLMSGPMGVVGLECAFPVLYTEMVKKGIISLEELVRLMTYAPAARFGIECGIEAGREAKLCVYDLDENYTVDPSKFKTKGRYTPFEGYEVYGRCLMTICGEKVHKYAE